jgi:hypothetical protein
VQNNETKHITKSGHRTGLSANDRPLGVEEVLRYGRRLVKSLNQATVYRNLKLLVDIGWLKRVIHPSLGTLYERAGKAIIIIFIADPATARLNFRVAPSRRMKSLLMGSWWKTTRFFCAVSVRLVHGDQVPTDANA